MLSYSYIAALQRMLHWRHSAILTFQPFSHCYTADAHLLLLYSCSATVTFQLFSHSFNIPAIYPRYTAAVQPLSQDPACSLLSRCHSAAGPAYYCIQQYTHNRLTRTVGRGHCFQALLST
jgi:hypothetical protein